LTALRIGSELDAPGRRHLVRSGEEDAMAMKDIDRRTAFVLGLATTAAAPALVSPRPAAAQTYGPTEGREVRPGVRQVDLSERQSPIAAYKTVKMRDIVIQPGAATEPNPMMNDMVCHMTEGELLVRLNDQQFTARKGDVWACAKAATTEGFRNTGSTVAVMRVIDLMTG
jgi:quercetin dioxygenase-like cupin family protein